MYCLPMVQLVYSNKSTGSDHEKIDKYYCACNNDAFIHNFVTQFVYTMLPTVILCPVHRFLQQ